MTLETPTLFLRDLLKHWEEQSPIFWGTLLRQKRLKTQVNTDLKLLWKAVMASHNFCNASCNEFFDKRIHLSIKQSIKIFCFGKNCTGYLYHKIHYSSNKVRSNLSQSAPAGTPCQWSLEAYCRSTVSKHISLYQQKVIPPINIAHVSSSLEWTTPLLPLYEPQSLSVPINNHKTCKLIVNFTSNF